MYEYIIIHVYVQYVCSMNMFVLIIHTIICVCMYVYTCIHMHTYQCNYVCIGHLVDLDNLGYWVVAYISTHTSTWRRGTILHMTVM